MHFERETLFKNYCSIFGLVSCLILEQTQAIQKIITNAMKFGGMSGHELGEEANNCLKHQPGGLNLQLLLAQSPQAEQKQFARRLHLEA